MRKSSLVVCGVLILGFLCREMQAAEVLQITPESGSIGFVGAKDDGTHKGGFKKFSGTVKLVPEKLTESQVVVEIETGSLWSDSQKLTAHLSNADFFDIDKFPKATFRSTALREAKPDDKKVAGAKKVTHVLSGTLTFLGVTKELKLPVTLELSDKAFAIKGTYSLDRTQFGMNYGIGKIHKQVPVEFSLVLPRK